MQYLMLHYLLIQGSFMDRKAFLYEGIGFHVHSVPTNLNRRNIHQTLKMKGWNNHDS